MPLSVDSSMLTNRPSTTPPHYLLVECGCPWLDRLLPTIVLGGKVRCKSLYSMYSYLLELSSMIAVRVKCSPEDTVGDLKKLIGAQTGTDPRKIQLKKWCVSRPSMRLSWLSNDVFL